MTFLPNPEEFSKHICQITIRTDDVNRKLYICMQCNKSYKTRSCLFRHKKYECGKLPTNKCDYCDHWTYHRSNMVVHMKRMHERENLNKNLAQNTQN